MSNSMNLKFRCTWEGQPAKRHFWRSLYIRNNARLGGDAIEKETEPGIHPSLNKTRCHEPGANGLNKWQQQVECRLAPEGEQGYKAPEDVIDEVVLSAPLADPGKDGRSSSKSHVAEQVQAGSSGSRSCGLGGGGNNELHSSSYQGPQQMEKSDERQGRWGSPCHLSVRSRWAC